jgi:chorismate synthase
MKPTASIALEQDSVDLKNNVETRLAIRGRHDPCIGIRAVPVLEACAALVTLDYMMEA